MTINEVDEKRVLHSFKEALGIVAERRNDTFSIAGKCLDVPETLDQRIKHLGREKENKETQGKKLTGWRKGVAVAALILVCLSMLHVFLYYNVEAYRNTIQKLYQPQEVKESLETLESVGIGSEILDDVLLPASMDIKVPNIDMDKVAKNTSITTLSGEFYDALIEHGYSDEGIKDMTLSQYEEIEASWLLSDEMIELLMRGYPELENSDLRSWTYGQYEDFYKAKYNEDLAARFTEEQLQELDDRGILIADTFYLFKEFHDPATMLAQSDAVLKQTIETYYQNKIDTLSSSAE